MAVIMGEGRSKDLHCHTLRVGTAEVTNASTGRPHKYIPYYTVSPLCEGPGAKHSLASGDRTVRSSQNPNPLESDLRPTVGALSESKLEIRPQAGMAAACRPATLATRMPG
jgi:hypothetical protein